MENTSKMKNLTNDLKAFEQMMKSQRKEKAEAETRKHRPRLLRDEEVPVRV